MKLWQIAVLAIVPAVLLSQGDCTGKPTAVRSEPATQSQINDLKNEIADLHVKCANLELALYSTQRGARLFCIQPVDKFLNDFKRDYENGFVDDPRVIAVLKRAWPDVQVKGPEPGYRNKMRWHE